jgi:hypothetical protein
MHVDQVSFALAMRELHANVNELPIVWNYPIHTPIADLPDVSPEIIHYHQRIDANLKLQSIGLPKVDSVIRKLNNRIAGFSETVPEIVLADIRL